MIRHVVSWKLKATDEAAKAASFDAMAAALGALPAVIPEMKTFSIGRDLVGTEKSWDVVLIADYDSVEALAAYQVHPAHVAAAAVVAENAADRVVVDFEF